MDAETVNRWLTGRIPRQRTRLAVALGETEADLWWPQARPDLNLGAEATAEVVGAYAHRADIPQQLWTSLLVGDQPHHPTRLRLPLRPGTAA